MVCSSRTVVLEKERIGIVRLWLLGGSGGGGRSTWWWDELFGGELSLVGEAAGAQLTQSNRLADSCDHEYL